MLLIAAEVKRLKRIGREEARKQWHKRYEEALEKFGVEVDGVRMLPDTPEIREFLARN